MNAVPSSGLPPSIIVSETDLARLEAMLESPQWRDHPAADALGEELARARVVPDSERPADVVGMHSIVECSDDHNGGNHQLTLVYPHESDAATHKVSILAPVGTALLGLSVGQSIDWDGPDGRRLRLRVTAVQSSKSPH